MIDITAIPIEAVAFTLYLLLLVGLLLFVPKVAGWIYYLNPKHRAERARHRESIAEARARMAENEARSAQVMTDLNAALDRLHAAIRKAESDAAAEGKPTVVVPIETKRRFRQDVNEALRVANNGRCPHEHIMTGSGAIESCLGEDIDTTFECPKRGDRS